MGFKIGNIIVDRVLYGIAEDANEKLLYTLSQLKNANIDVTSESTDVTDKSGNLVRRIYTGKTGEFTTTNAFVNLNILGAQTGGGVKEATADAPRKMPKSVKVTGATTLDISDIVVGGTDSDPTYNIAVNAFVDGELDKEYTLGASESETNFAVVKTGSKIELKLPTDATVATYFVKYTRNVKSGVSVINTAKDFPETVKLTLKAVIHDVCTKKGSDVKIAYITIPSFQPSPDVSFAIDKESQELEFKGNMNVDFCSDDKELYIIDIAEDDNEADD